MYKGKYSSQNRKYEKRRLRGRKEFVLLCSIVVLLIGVIGGSVAYLFTSTQNVENSFVAPVVDVEIPEDFKDGDTVKKDVCVKNACDFEVYARATYVAYWQNDNNEIYPEVPELDVRINNTDWTSKDGYWYCNKILGKDEKSPAFIKSAKLAEGAEVPNGYHLVIDVIGEVVQANPVKAVTDVWGFVPETLAQGG